MIVKILPMHLALTTLVALGSVSGFVHGQPGSLSDRDTAIVLDPHTEKKTAPMSCGSSDECSAPDRCSGGKCTAEYSTAPESCSLDAQCGIGESCHNGSCEP